MSTRDQRALALLAAVLVLGLVYRFWPDSSTPKIVAPSDPVGLAEKRLAKMRELAATVPAKQELLKKASAELAAREKGLITADTAAQAQAQLVEIVRTLGRAEAPPVEIRSYELGPVRALGDAYGEAPVAVNIECRIDQLVNMIAAIGSRPELITTTDLRVTSNNVREKTVGVRLAVAAVVPRRLLPERRSNSRTGGQF